MGKRAAEVELFVGNMSSIQREDSAFYAKGRSASHDNRTRTNPDHNASKHCLDCVHVTQKTSRSCGSDSPW